MSKLLSRGEAKELLGKKGIIISTSQFDERLVYSRQGELVINVFEDEAASDFYIQKTMLEEGIKVPLNDRILIHKVPHDLYLESRESKPCKTGIMYYFREKELEVIYDENAPGIITAEHPNRKYEEEDFNMSNLTARQYACIHCGVPETGIGWLDGIIKTGYRLP